MNELLKKANKWLTELGIRTEFHSNCVKVNRDDVHNFVGDEANELLKELKAGIGDKRLVWANRCDNWYYLESF